MPTVVYFVLCEMGRRLGTAWVERDPANMTRAETLIDIRSGELRDVIMIIETEFTGNGLSSRDVTEDMLKEAGYDEPIPPSDRLAALHDHAQDERKNWRG